MKKIYFILFFVLVLCGFSNAQNINAIEPELQEILKQKDNELIDIQIYFKSKVNSNQINKKTRNVSDKSGKREIVINELKTQSQLTQAEVMAILKAEELNGNVENINSLWIASSISCKASRDVIYKLSSHPDIEIIGYDKEFQVISPEQMKEIEKSHSAMRGPAAHIVTVNADDVWNQGYTGKNIIVAVLDSGTNTQHVDFKDHLWEGYVDTNNDGTPDKLVNGWNFIGNNDNISDDFGHGTHCAGIVCGDGTSGTSTGVAPDATLMTVKTIGQAGGGSVSAMISGVQFAVENGADVLSLSLGYKHSQLTVEQKESIREAFDNVLGAGVVACAAVGNDGTSIGLPWNVDYPAACPAPWLNPDQIEGGISGVIAVGADDLIGQSSQGPSTWEDTKYNDYAYSNGANMGLIRPDISAPGNMIISTNHLVNNEYKLMSGTSQATPCVAGVIALMLEKNSSLTPAQISEIIEESAANKPASKNNVVGSGRVDALSAVNTVTEGTRSPFVKLASFTPQTTTPGQTVSVSLTFKNEGKGSSASATSTAISLDNDPYVTISNPTQTLGQISTGNSKTISFDITIDAQTPNGHIAVFNVVTTSGTNKWSDAFSVKITATPNIVFHSANPISVNVDQDVDINVTMINNGTAPLNETTTLTLSTLSSDLKYVTIVDNEATINPLGVGATGTGTFTIRANNTVPHNYGFDFFLEIYSESSETTDYVYGFENDTEGWTSFDAANNSISKPGNAIEKPWYHASEAGQHGKTYNNSHSGNGHLMSSSNENPYYYTNPLNNYLVSPNKIKATTNSQISFYARANFDEYYAEHFGVAISTNGNTSANDFTTIQEWIIPKSQGDEWTKYTVDLGSYAGQEFYIAIRHFFNQNEWTNSEKGYDFDALNIDDILLSDVAINLSHTPTYSQDDPNHFKVYVNNMVEMPKVENLTATAVSTSEINLAWNAITNAHSYNIYRNGQRIATVTENSYTDQNLNHNTEYCYEVAAVYSGMAFEHSDKACATTQQLARNIIVKDYSPKTIYVGSNDGSISYTLLNDGANQLDSYSFVTVTCNSGYVTFSGTDSYVRISPLASGAEVTKTASITVDPNIPNNSTLTFNLNVSNTSIGTLNPSDYFTFDLPIQITVKNDPGTPKNLTIKNFSDNSITLGWDAVANATSYNIYRDGEYVGNTPSTTYFDNGLNFSTQYCYTVTSINTDGESDHSEQVCQTTKKENLGIVLKSFELEAGIGKDIELVATLVNKGSETKPAGTARLACNDQYVNIVSGSADFGAITANGETTVTFIVNLDAAIPTNYVLNFDVTAEYEGSNITNLPKYTFDTGFDNWTIIDYNNNNHTWYHSSETELHSPSIPTSYAGTGHIMNATYCKSHSHTKKDVDDIVFAPKKVTICNDTEISFYVRSTGNYVYEEKYAVIITETLNGAYTEFSIVWGETLSSAGWQHKSVKFSDYPEYVGKNVHIGIYHYGCNGDNADGFCLDEVEITNIMEIGTISNSSTISVTVNPSLNTFAGEGLWSDASKWSKGVVPTISDDVIISGNATIESGDITVKSLSINNNTTASLTVNNGASLTVSETMVNKNADAFIINDGAQIFQNSNNVAATFRMLIDNPTSWNKDHKGGWQFIASPVTGAPVIDFVPETTDYDLYKYDGAEDFEWINYKKSSTEFDEKFQQGQGYLVSYEALTSADFKGFLNTDKTFTFNNIKAFDSDSHFKNFYLLGNPFSFDMNWNSFTKFDIYDGFAIIDSKDGSYEYKIAPNDDVKVKVGDGFFVKAIGPEPKLSNNVRKIHSESYESFDITVSNIYGNDNTIVKLNGQEDEGFTKLDNFNKDITEIFVIQDSQRYGIISIDENTEKLNIGFEAKHIGDHIISIETEGEFEYVTLTDNFSGEEIDMLNDRYEFKAYSTVASHDRFTLKFRKKTQEDDSCFAYQSGNELIINAEGSIQIIDIMGRIIHTETVSGDSKINISNYNKAVYLIRCIGKSKTSTQKIIIK